MNTEKSKTNLPIIIFAVIILLFAIFSGYVFFNNTSNLEISIHSNNEKLKRDVAINEALTELLVQKNDSIDSLDKKISEKESIFTAAQKTDSVKNSTIKKLAHEKDSLINLLRNSKWSDLEPVDSKQPK